MAGGGVLEDELVAKAADLDRRFDALTTKADNFFKAVVVGVADAAVEAADLRAKLDEIFLSGAQAEALLGSGVKDALDGDRDALDAHTEQVGLVR